MREKGLEREREAAKGRTRVFRVLLLKGGAFEFFQVFSPFFSILELGIFDLTALCVSVSLALL